MSEYPKKIRGVFIYNAEEEAFVNESLNGNKAKLILLLRWISKTFKISLSKAKKYFYWLMISFLILIAISIYGLALIFIGIVGCLIYLALKFFEKNKFKKIINKTYISKDKEIKNQLNSKFDSQESNEKNINSSQIIYAGYCLKSFGIYLLLTIPIALLGGWASWAIAFELKNTSGSIVFSIILSFIIIYFIYKAYSNLFKAANYLISCNSTNTDVL
tara:strand:- start:398 stop:1048 length:651 start_codon:yes stop_codon:yes gene_type:complete